MVAAARGEHGAAPPAVVVAAPASGNGKTTIATGLMAALGRRGHTVAPFKVGPDFIDPHFHALATGRPGRNLDANLQRAELLAPLYAHGARGADLAVIEGVMGLFDGRIGHLAPDGVSGYGSTAHVAAALGAPVLLVVDVRGYSQSLGAVVRGFISHAPGIRIAGIILNQVGSPRHVDIATAACEDVGVPVVGAVPREARMVLPERHLGLVTPDALTGDPGAQIEALADVIAGCVDLEAITDMATTDVECPPWRPPRTVSDGEDTPVIAVASGPAFGFCYPEWDECLRAAGARIVYVDPRTDCLPADTAGLFLPGGYPEEHAADLAANTTIRAQLRAAVDAGMPVYAECGGLVYLGSSLDGQPMVGAIAAEFHFGGHLHLGYREAVALTSTPMLATGRRVVGHEFHRTTMNGAAKMRGAAGAPAFAWRGGAAGAPSVTDGIATGRLHASYLHLHPAGVPEVATGLVAAARNFRLEQ